MFIWNQKISESVVVFPDIQQQDIVLGAIAHWGRNFRQEENEEETINATLTNIDLVRGRPIIYYCP